MGTIDVYMTQMRRAKDRAETDDILFRAAKDPQVCSRDYRVLINEAFGPVLDKKPIVSRR